MAVSGGGAGKPGLRRRPEGWRRWLLLALLVPLLLVFAFVLAAAWRLMASRPRLEGVVRAPIAQAVTIARDAGGVPTIRAADRDDAAFALGYLHAQERFFEMDSLRRAAAGELSELFGAATLPADRDTRRHLFRARAERALAGFTPAERATLDAYTAGVNQGLRELGAAPFEYALLGEKPQPWQPEDSLLVVYAMFLDLQDSEPKLEIARARAAARVGPGMAELLYPMGTELDGAIDGSRLAPPALPARLEGGAAPRPKAPGRADEPLVKGSNDWAVAGGLTFTGAAVVSNDMHLHTTIPNIWYRARIQAGSLDVTGVTLPGVWPMIAGSNGRIAWGYTDSYIDAHDAVAIEPVPGRAGWYRTPAGPRAIQHIPERICTHSSCETLVVEETIWGPIIATLADGRRVADRWLAHDFAAVRLAPAQALEAAGSVAEAVAIAHRSGIPDQNLVVGDRRGHIAWTIIGRVPRRFGFDGRDATSWADGTRGWAGTLAPDAVPTIMDPPGGRVWTANGRVVGGAALSLLGSAGYDDGMRPARIHALLLARQRFTERDMLAIQLDTRADRMRFWQAQMLAALARHPRDGSLTAMVGPVRAWSGRADAASVGYRLIRSFRLAVVNASFAAYVGTPPDPAKSYAVPASEEGMRLLLRARPPALVPPGFHGWDGLIDAALASVGAQVAEAGGVDGFTWGRWLHAGVHHPLAGAVPLLGLLTDPKDVERSGDGSVVRAQYRGAGASERFTVSPGHEASGLFHMPGGQSGNPLSPYYLAGHKDWLEGRPTPLLPGPAQWTMWLTPAGPGER